MTTERYYFVCNPAANSGRLKKNWVKIQEIVDRYLSQDQYKVDFTTAPLNAVDLTRKAIESKQYTHVISVGGDGVANEVVNALMRTDHDMIMGMIPAGTSNDGHQTHNFPLELEPAIELLFENHVERFGVGKITGDFGSDPHYFFDHCDTGLAALAARSAKYGSKLLKGEWKYTWYALKNLARFKNNPGTVVVDEETYEGDFAIVAAGFGEDMSGYNLWPDNSNKEGNFGVLLGYDKSRFGLLKLMLAAEKGNHIGREGVVYRRGKKITIDLERGWPYQAEGEIFTEDSKRTEMEYVPDALKFVTVEEE